MKKEEQIICDFIYSFVDKNYKKINLQKVESIKNKKSILEEVKNNFEFCGNFVDWYKSNIGEILNPFDDVEKFHCIMMIFAVEGAYSYALNKTKYSDLWNEEVEITEEFVNEIEEAIEDTKEDDIF